MGKNEIKKGNRRRQKRKLWRKVRMTGMQKKVRVGLKRSKVKDEEEEQKNTEREEGKDTK